MVEIYGYSIATVPIVVLAVYGIIEFLKYFIIQKNERVHKCIPLFAACFGGIISVSVYFIAPEFVPVSHWFNALLMGVASGLSAVGVNQIKKQMSNGGEERGS